MTQAKVNAKSALSQQSGFTVIRTLIKFGNTTDSAVVNRIELKPEESTSKRRLASWQEKKRQSHTKNGIPWRMRLMSSQEMQFVMAGSLKQANAQSVIQQKKSKDITMTTQNPLRFGGSARNATKSGTVIANQFTSKNFFPSKAE
jgi:phosphoribosylanthranilate isomerase